MSNQSTVMDDIWGRAAFLISFPVAPTVPPFFSFLKSILRHRRLSDVFPPLLALLQSPIIHTLALHTSLFIATKPRPTT
jgi:hypothetical protein